jgi:hypothetical protein
MSTDRLLDRVRAANPAPPATIADDELFARIVAAPGDPRLASTPKRRPLRMRTRGVAVIAAAVVLSASGGAFGLGAFSHDSPKALFEANPAGPFPWRPGQGVIVPAVIPQTVRLATTFMVPEAGRFQLWIALSKPKGWLCTAIRQPDGTYAGLPSGDRYQLAGPMPGCGMLGLQDVHGFDYWPSSIGSRDGRQWWVAWGYAPTAGHPVEVRDALSGISAPIGDGRYFAIVIPQTRPGFRLQTLDAAGRVLVTDRFDTGH